MKYAASIRYGGQLVDAEDCDYEDYKKLQLLCPECKEPVFLQKGFLRILVNKESPIPAHFKHFPCVAVELAKSCESRIKQYDLKEIEKRKSQAKNQRLKLLQSDFWTLFLNNAKPLGFENDGVSPQKMQTFINRFLAPERVIYFDKDRFESKESANAFYFKYIAKKPLDNNDTNSRKALRECMLDDLMDYFITPESKFWIEHKQKFSSKANTKLSETILQEIIDFVCCKSSLQLRLNCFAFGVLKCAYNSNWDWFYTCLVEGEVDLWRVCAASFIMELIQIDWTKALTDIDKYKNGEFKKELVY